MEVISLLQPLGFNTSSCGYCKQGKGVSYGIWAHQMTPLLYESMINHGWRRSGSYLYKPDTSIASCCAQFTIKLNVNEFTATKSQRKVVNSFNEFIQFGARGREGFGNLSAGIEENIDEIRKREITKGKGKNSSHFDLVQSIHQSEHSNNPPPFKPFAHKFEFTLEPAEFSQEKYDLYEKYQLSIHQEPPSKISKAGFKRFLCDNPFNQDTAQHGMYRIDDQLVAFSVVDILPKSISSVYLVWDPDFYALSLGKYACLREIAMAQERILETYHLGLIIVDCDKMKYKSTFSPSFLLDPTTNEYYPYDYCKKLLDLDPHASFSKPPTTTLTSAAMISKATDVDVDVEEGDDMQWPIPSPPGFLDPKNLPKKLLEKTMVLYDDEGSVIPYIYSKAFFDKTETQSREAIAALGEVLIEGRIALLLKD